MNQIIKFEIEDAVYTFSFYRKLLHFSVSDQGDIFSEFIYYSEIVDASLRRNPIRLTLSFIDQISEVNKTIEIEIPKNEFDKISTIGQILEKIEYKIKYEGDNKNDKMLN